MAIIKNPIVNKKVITEDITVTPSTVQQTINRSEDKYINSVTVNAVTSDIDANITPENIKKDVSILGVTGTLQSGSGGINPAIIERTLTEITADDLGGVTKIGDWAFYLYKTLLSIIIPDSVTSIGDRSFYGCSGLTGALTIPDSVKSIGDAAFQSCSDLTIANIYTTSSTNKISRSYSDAWFYFCSASLVIHIPASVKSPTTAYGYYWNVYNNYGGTLTYYADL